VIDASGLRARAAVLHAVRSWFHARGYLEVPTAVRVPSPAMEENLFAVPSGAGFLRTSPEFALKRALAAGLGRIYEIGPCFRGRESGAWHGTEFTMLEWYRAGAELADLMQDVQDLVHTSATAVGAAPPPRWERWTVRDLVRDRTGVDIATASADNMSATSEPWDDAFFRLWVDRVEPTLTGAVFVEGWPASQAALARVRTDGPMPVACRFEAYLNGVELANAFLELTDGAEQRRRFERANAARVASGEPPHPVDEALIQAVGTLPRTCGIALGVDRLVAAVCGWSSIAPGRVASLAPSA
jgi:elongation factor P--(R)-beta-lysine ligase